MYAFCLFCCWSCFCSSLYIFCFGMSLREKDGRGQILFMHTPRSNGRFF